MAVCEMCGTDSPKAKRVFVEGTLLMLCPKCARFGKSPETDEPREEPRYAPRTTGTASVRARPRKDRSIYESDSNEVLAEDYSKRIRDARNNLGWTQEELGKKINERKSVISSLESGTIRPDVKLMRKLEKALKIKLTEVMKEAVIRHKSSDKSFTIGDILKREGEG